MQKYELNCGSVHETYNNIIYVSNCIFRFSDVVMHYKIYYAIARGCEPLTVLKHTDR